MILPASAMPVLGSAPTPILDIVGNATAAYSTARRLSSNNTSPFLVRRGTILSGGATQNAVYTYDNETNQSDLTIFRGANTTLKIQTWYDQSGNGNNAANTTWGQEPSIYGSGFFALLNNKLSSYYFASDLRNLGLTSAITLASEYVVFMVVLPENDNPQLNGTITGSNSYFRAGTLTADMANSTQYTTGSNIGATAQIYRGQKQSGILEVYTNGTLRTVSTLSFARNNSITNIGRHLLAGGALLYYQGIISEIIIYNRSMTTDEITTVENNIRAYYGL